MISIAEIFDNSKELLDSISGFVDKYIGTELLRKCHITKVPEAPRSFKISVIRRCNRYKRQRRIHSGQARICPKSQQQKGLGLLYLY